MKGVRLGGLGGVFCLGPSPPPASPRGLGPFKVVNLSEHEAL